jgi:hypothetical protein
MESTVVDRSSQASPSAKESSQVSVPQPAVGASSCCSPVKQASCCEPSEKASCCGEATSRGCGCR